ncbi:hypothetical protein [Pseudomonas alliivorans]|uniref:hypothetical protein n=1 Tax=Pseudomonas alliivorans TaxID=2810613 RepID=UPI002090C552|nr:hypothetical protein [Pseudomonas alliivorans]MCO5364790.1 hypothetical protein [Pseudomonas alliivorans]
MTIPVIQAVAEGRKHLDLAPLQQLARAATPGVWERSDGCEYFVSYSGDEAYWSWEQAGPAQVHGSGNQPVADADFIAAASPSVVLALISEIVALRAQLEAK